MPVTLIETAAIELVFILMIVVISNFLILFKLFSNFFTLIHLILKTRMPIISQASGHKKRGIEQKKTRISISKSRNLYTKIHICLL